MTPKQTLFKIKKELDTALVGSELTMYTYAEIVEMLTDVMSKLGSYGEKELKEDLEAILDSNTSNPDEPNHYEKALSFCKNHGIKCEVSKTYDLDVDTLVVTLQTEESLNGYVTYYIPYDKPWTSKE
jgi:hypothetical protein